MNVHEHTFDAIGTRWSITLPNTISSDAEQHALAAVHERIAQFDAVYSRFRSDSWVSRIAATPGEYTLPADAKPLLDIYQELYALTDGAMTPLIGDVLIAAGYDADYSLTPKEMHAPFSWDEALTYDYPNLNIKKQTMLDFGAAGKGYLVDIISELLMTQGITAYILNAGGDICVWDEKGGAVQIALEHPDDATKAIGVATLRNASICGSSGNRRAWDTYTHIMDPRTLQSPRDTLAVWVVAPTTLLADALTTALYFTSPQTLAEQYSFDYALLRPDYSIERSFGFPAELFFS